MTREERLDEIERALVALIAELRQEIAHRWTDTGTGPGHDEDRS